MSITLMATTPTLSALANGPGAIGTCGGLQVVGRLQHAGLSLWRDPSAECRLTEKPAVYANPGFTPGGMGSRSGPASARRG